MSSWQSALEGARFAKALGTAAALCSIALALSELLGADNVRWPAVILCLLAAHALTAHFAFNRIAQLQASLDMKRLAMDMRKSDVIATQNFSLDRGERLPIAARDGPEFVISAKQAPGHDRVTLTVEYLG